MTAISSESLFWEEVRSTPTDATPDDAPYPETPGLTVRQFKEMLMLDYPLYPLNILCDWLDKNQTKGPALDLGCGRGINTKILLTKGWRVLSVDMCSKSLEILKSSIPLEYERKFKVQRADITTSGFKENSYQLIVAADALPYIKPIKLQSLMEKIFKAVKPGGFFIGTLFFSYSEESFEQQKPFLSSGVHFYRGYEFANNLLTYSGFTVLDYQKRRSDNPLELVIEFIAQKIIPESS